MKRRGTGDVVIMRVLIALDGSEASEHAARAAVQLFGPEADYLVVTVAEHVLDWATPAAFGTVVPVGPVMSWPPEPLLGGPEAPASVRQVADELHARLITESGDAASVLADAADSHDVDVLVVGNHHRSVLSRLWEPATLNRLLKHCSRPVLVVAGQDGPRG